MKKSNEYMRGIKEACGTELIEPEGLYCGREGHLRLARECGYALNDFTEKEQDNILKSSYSTIYVIACHLKPILDAKEWIDGLTEGWNEAKAYNSK